MKNRPLFRRALPIPVLCAATLSLFAAVTATQAQVPGDQDAAFATGPASSGSVHALALQPNGQVLVGGGFSSFRGAARNSVARLNPDGSLDSFNPGLAITGYEGGTGTVYALGLQADGKVIAAGGFTVLGQTAGGGVVRLNADGSLDGSFNVGAGVVDGPGGVGEAQAVAVLPNGQILVGGLFRDFNGATAPGLARLNADGSVDASFNAGGSGVAFNGYGNGVESIVVLANGQIYIGGGFSSYNGVAEGGVARLNADGSLDATFQSGQGADESVSTLGVQADGKILAGGGFNNFDGASIQDHLVRLNTDGSLDTGYIPSLPGVFNVANINALLVQPDGSVIIGGEFLFGGSLVGSPGSGVLRLDSEGAMDDSFDGSNGVGEAASLVLQPDGKLLVAYDENGFVATGPGDVLRAYDLIAAITPTVNIAAGVAKTNEDGSTGPATFVVSLSVASSTATVVKYAVKGSAIPGFDYQQLSGKVKIKPGHTSATISVYPYEEDINDGSVVKVKVALQPGNGYAVGTASGAKVKIVDNE